MPSANEWWDQAQVNLNAPVGVRTAACMGRFLADRQRAESFVCGGPALSQALADRVIDIFKRAGHRLTLRTLASDWLASPSHLYLVYPAPMAVFETSWDHVSSLRVEPVRSSVTGTLLGRPWSREPAPGRPADVVIATSRLVWWQADARGTFAARTSHGQSAFAIEAMDPSARERLLDLVRAHWPRLVEPGEPIE